MKKTVFYDRSDYLCDLAVRAAGIAMEPFLCKKRCEDPHSRIIWFGGTRSAGLLDGKQPDG